MSLRPTQTQDAANNDEEGSLLLEEESQETSVDEGPTVLTVPKYKKYAKKTGTTPNGMNSDNKFVTDDDATNEFIELYKLQSIAKPIADENITVSFLLTQTKSDVDAISKALTTNAIQQKKFKFAVQEMQRNNNTNERAPHMSTNFEVFDTPKKNQRIAVSKKTEKISKRFSKDQTITSWYYNGSDGLQHEIILKHATKMSKALKSKRSVFVDGQERYNKKSNDVNFVIQDCADHLKIEIEHQNNDIFYELYINNVSFTDLMNPETPSFSL